VTLSEVGILIFDGVEVLDFCGPFEVFSMASKPDTPSMYPEPSLFRVRTVAETKAPIRAVGGLEVIPSCTIDDHPLFEILVIPGGFGTRAIYSDRPRVTEWIAGQYGQVSAMTSVCTGAFLLAKAGLLAGNKATTHWASIERLREQHPDIEVIDDERVVDQGNIVTSAGVSAGIDMALHIVARMHGHEAAAQTARDMEYRWEPAL
jgi:transcriptional regulator GlxA family with amidase domain